MTLRANVIKIKKFLLMDFSIFSLVQRA